MAATTAPVHSWNCKAYYNAGSYASPTWTLISNMGEVALTDERDDVDIPLRSNGAFMAGVPGFRKVSFAWKMLFNLADTAQTAIRTAYDAGTSTELLFADQAVATSGATGIRAVCYWKKCNRTEEDGKPAMVEVEAKPYAAAPQAPERFTASA